MSHYYVNNGTDDRGDHEVHRDGCHVMPNDRTYLGFFTSCHPAVAKARTIYERSNGCVHCSRECHTG
jgi:hypothetical protein